MRALRCAFLIPLGAALLLGHAMPVTAQSYVPSPPPTVAPRPPRITVPVIVPKPPMTAPERVRPAQRPTGDAGTPSARPKAAPKHKPASSATRPPSGKGPTPRTAVPTPAPRPSPLTGEPRREPNVVLVAFPGGTGEAVAQALAAANGLTVLERSRIGLIDRELYRLRIDSGRSVDEVVATLGGINGVSAARPNALFLAQQANAKPAGIQYAVKTLKLAEAHARAQGRGVRLAVIDTGVDTSHEVLRSAHMRSVSVVADRPTPQDHGTEIVGAIAAGGALTGVAPLAEIIAIEAFTPSPSGGAAEATAYGLVKALDRAWDERARIVNMSFAGVEEPLITQMLDALAGKDVVLVAAAGNEGPDAPPAHPAAHREVMAVTATNAQDMRFERANRGPHILIAAPGVDVLAPASGGVVRMTSGTSIAAAHVAGAVALLLESRPDLDTDAIRALLAASARDLGAPGRDADYGAGLLDPLRALEAASASPVGTVRAEMSP